MAQHEALPSIDSPSIRHSAAGPLSLAFMDSRNRTLQLLGVIEQALDARTVKVHQPDGEASPLWIAGHIGWFAEYWIGRNTQRARGEACPSEPTRLASIEPKADRWWRPTRPWGQDAHPGEPRRDLPDGAGVRDWLRETIESTLELLDRAGETDEALYFFRLALLHEDLRCEQLVTLAQTLGIAPALADESTLQGAPVMRDGILVPATRWTLGTSTRGFAVDNERAAHQVQVPEFEIDAQPVTWSQYVEFVDDGGYDRQELWSAGGWQWLQAQAQMEGRRGPRHVDEIGTSSGAVTVERFGQRVRVAGSQSVVHVSAWEADAWATWAGRRVVTEVEWDLAARTAQGRGFRWGDVLEWTAGTFRPYPGFAAGPWSDYSTLSFGQTRAMRGASFATHARLRDPSFRRFAPPAQDDHFSGFRTCTL